MNRDELIALMRSTADEKPTKVKVKEWGDIYIRSLTVAEVQVMTETVEAGKDKNALAKGAAMLICDEKGKRIFDPENAEDIALLASQPWRLLNQVTDASKKLIEGDTSGK